MITRSPCGCGRCVHWCRTGRCTSPQPADPIQNREVRSTDVDEQPEDRPTKQVIVVRRDLRMRRGKEIAQGAHAATAWLAELVIRQMMPGGTVNRVQLSQAERAWLETSFRKVTVKVGSEEELMAVYAKALEAGLVIHLITDRGLTEFGGVPTRTCLAIGPDYDDVIDPVTGDLELY
jgi:peptidyl-tRNA hydrolase, PTH2 family